MKTATRLPTRPDRGIGPRSDRGRARVLGAAVGVVTAAVVLGLLVVGGVLWNDDAPVAIGPAATADFESYLAEVEPIAKDAGRVVQLGLKKGITDIGESKYDDRVLTGMADGWAGEFETLRADLAAVTPPQSMEDAHADLVAAFDGYLAVAATLGEAARAPSVERPALADRAAQRGEAADDTWDRGAAALQARANDLDLPAIPWLPQPTSPPIQGDNL